MNGVNLSFNIEEVAKIIDVPIEKWGGRCHEIARLMLDKKLVVGKLRYGHWLGLVSEKSMFGKYPNGLVRHGWIELDDGNIVDPTRFEFEQKEPYIYVGKNDYYDAGGNIWRMKMMVPAPEFSEEEKHVILSVNSDATMNLLEEMLKVNGSLGKIIITVKQAFWLANLPLQAFEGLAKPIYEALIEAKLGAFIPYDNSKIVME